MKSRNRIVLVCAFLTIAFTLSAQLGIRGGVNMANEVKSFDKDEINAAFSSENLNGFHIGLVYQAHQKTNPALGFELGAFLAQKGSAFDYGDLDAIEIIKKGYREINFIEVPLNLRFRVSLGIIGIYGFGGIYGAYALNGKTVDEASDEILDMTFGEFTDRLDYGYAFGGGLELFKKLQLGAAWSRGLKNTAIKSDDPASPVDSKHKVFSVNLTFLF